ncbi:MAG: hypothetical protein ACOCVR_00340 [Myxococcota bacterium]
MRCLACLDRTPGTPLTAEAAFAFYAAAARELFEEAGVLLAKTATDAPVDTSRLNDWRRRLQDGTGAFSELLATECLTLDVDALSYLSHWITPSAEPMRFDTRFFALPLPDEQTPLFDHKETTDGAWWSGEEALAAHAAGTILLAPPTIRHLEELARHRHLASYLEEMRGREVAPILPKMVMDGETMLVVLPWDEEYEGLEGESLNLGPHPWARTGGPSRFVLRDGRFFSKP